jgi:hypothetical protein
MHGSRSKITSKKISSSSVAREGFNSVVKGLTLYTLRLQTPLQFSFTVAFIWFGFMACGVDAQLFRTHDLTKRVHWPRVSYIYFVLFQCSSGWRRWSCWRLVSRGAKDGKYCLNIHWPRALNFWHRNLAFKF